MTTMTKAKTIEVWVTRDSKKGDEPDKLFIHAKKPELDNGTWTAGVDCLVVPDVKRGQRKRLRLGLEEL